MIPQYKLVDAAQLEDFTQPFWWNTFHGPSDRSIQASDVETLCSHSRRLYANLGPLRTAIQDKAMYAVGRHWLPVFKGSDQAFKLAAQDWLVHNFYPVCNVLGQEFDFQTTLWLLSVHLDVFAEVFIYLTEADNGYPQIQLVPRHRVNQPRKPGSIDRNAKLVGGPYDGYLCKQGVVKNKAGRAIAFHVLGDAEDGSEDQFVNTDDMVRLRELEIGDETRAIPATSHGINQGRSILSLLQNEQRFLELASRIALIENNELGGLDPNDPQNALLVRPAPPGGNLDGEPAPQNPARSAYDEYQEQAQTRYFRGKDGGSLTPFQFQRPAKEWHDFIGVELRFLIDPIWPYYLVDREGELGGANCRALAARANRLVQDRQDLLRKAARRIVQYGVAKGSKIGRIPESDEWWMWDFTLPPRITVDFGRDAKAELLEIEGEIMDPAEPIEARGKSYEEFLFQFYRNQARKRQIKAQVEQETGVDLSDLPEPQVSGGGQASEVDD
jgi:hypothetical protein